MQRHVQQDARQRESGEQGNAEHQEKRGGAEFTLLDLVPFRAGAGESMGERRADADFQQRDGGEREIDRGVEPELRPA